MTENPYSKKSVLLRYGLLAGFKFFLWKGEEIISRIFITKKSVPLIQTVQRTDDPYPPSSWVLAGTRLCCMALDGNRLEIHVLPENGKN
jgi:hypothetical protein